VNLADALEHITAATGIDVTFTEGDGLAIAGNTIGVPSDLNPLDLKAAFPAKGYGDQREKLLYMFVEDATDPGASRPTDLDLRAELGGHLDAVRDDASRDRLAEVMREHYWTVPKRGKRAHLLPFHASLPHGYKLHTRYKMYRGNLLAFLCWTGSEFNIALLDQLFELFNTEDDFSRLDQLFVSAAEAWAGEASATTAALLTSSEVDEVEAALRGGGAYCQPHLEQFQADLGELLTLRDRIPRRDLIDALILLTGFHLGTYYYRVALTLGEGLDRVAAIAAGAPDPGGGCDCTDGLAGCPLAGRIQFRTGTAGYRPASERDPSVRSYRDLHLNRLMGLASSIITSNHCGWLSAATGGPSWEPSEGRPQLSALAEHLLASADRAGHFDTSAWALAALYADRSNGISVDDVANSASGLVALRSAVTAHQRTSLRKYSTDVVNMLLRPQQESGRLVAGNGTRISFFEVDEPLVFLLVRLACGSDRLRADDFMQALRRYGLEPQDRAEQERLLAALERLGMIRKYSDAGESTYVRHPL